MLLHSYKPFVRQWSCWGAWHAPSGSAPAQNAGWRDVCVVKFHQLLRYWGSTLWSGSIMGPLGTVDINKTYFTHLFDKYWGTLFSSPGWMFCWEFFHEGLSPVGQMALCVTHRVPFNTLHDTVSLTAARCGSVSLAGSLAAQQVWWHQRKQTGPISRCRWIPGCDVGNSCMSTIGSWRLSWVWKKKRVWCQLPSWFWKGTRWRRRKRERKKKRDSTKPILIEKCQ